MGKEQVKVTGANGEELELELGGGAQDGEAGESELAEEETAAQEGKALEGSESDEGEDEEALDLDWKAARAKLKEHDAATSWSIEHFEKRAIINKLKERYNNKERSKSLYDAIEALE